MNIADAALNIRIVSSDEIPARLLKDGLVSILGDKEALDHYAHRIYMDIIGGIDVKSTSHLYHEIEKRTRGIMESPIAMFARAVKDEIESICSEMIHRQANDRRTFRKGRLDDYIEIPPHQIEIDGDLADFNFT